MTASNSSCELDLFHLLPASVILRLTKKFKKIEKVIWARHKVIVMRHKILLWGKIAAGIKSKPLYLPGGVPECDSGLIFISRSGNPEPHSGS